MLPRLCTVCIINRCQHLLWSSADGDIIGQIDPLNRPVSIDQELGWSRNVSASSPGVRVQNIVATDDCGVRVGQHRKGEAHLLRVIPVDLDRIDADGCDFHAAGREIAQTMLETPQLGVA